jgi:hypothetical protein
MILKATRTQKASCEILAPNLLRGQSAIEKTALTIQNFAEQIDYLA